MTEQEMIENGQRLFQSAENLRRSAPDLDALLESLWEALKDKKLFGESVELGRDYDSVETWWMTSAYARHADILSRPARAQGQRGRSKNPERIGTISIVARLCNSDNIDGELPDWPWLDQACLIVGWHPKQNSDDHWEIGNFDPDDDSLAYIVHAGDGLWAWHQSDGDHAYFFVLPVFALTNEVVLKRLALRPLKALFDADDPRSVAEEALRDVPVLLP